MRSQNVVDLNEFVRNNHNNNAINNTARLETQINDVPSSMEYTSPQMRQIFKKSIEDER